MGKYFVKSNTKEHRDQETGEVTTIEQEKILSIKFKGEEFYQTYVGFLAKLYGLEHVSDYRLITKFCEIAEYNTGKVSISAGKRQLICQELGLNTTNFSKYVKRLKENSLITGDKGEYQLNPSLFWKGEQKVRAQVLKDQGFNLVINFRAEEESED